MNSRKESGSRETHSLSSRLHTMIVKIISRHVSTQALFIVSKRWLYHTHSMLKNSKPYRERMPLGSMRGNRESFGSSGME
ncbi:MAG: hypothetical protein J9259_08495 [Thermoplasmata archaeon YP2-bin.285]|uniref:Uncharacterized protein n=1 Tax=Candidatus Sysuiplasma superficiale TaxID=2823368 RepID=A0A8J8CBK1_9ARCH|nr:hypothetical protein [Candidatus Sysuiplasma superficiale]